MAAGSFALIDVWLNAGPEGQVFSYRNSLEEPARRGDLVQVRLRGRWHSGLVMAEHASVPERLLPRLRPVESIIERQVLDDRWWGWLQSVAQRCHCSLFRTLRAALPPGWLGRQRSARQQGPPRLRRSLQIHLSDSPPSDGQDASGVPGKALTPRQRELQHWLAEQGGTAPLSEITLKGGFSHSLVKTLHRLSVVRIDSAAMPDRRGLQDPGPVAAWPSPTQEQRNALESFHRLPRAGGMLLWGVTGSGKTEIYLRAAAAALERGESVLILTPEIGLIPQLLDRCRQRFGERVLEYHSGCSDQDRVRTWHRCLTDRADQPSVVVGTRSAIFLPLPRIGLIVLDEEHDRSYKQETPMPCYHCRDLARLRCQHYGSKLILGSATPSLESWRDSEEEGHLELQRLRERVHRRPLPPVRLVDMRLELAAGHRRVVSRPLRERLRRLREEGDQAVILVPRRGYNSFVSCRTCGAAVQCPHCDVALTVHRGADGDTWLRCHWCDHRMVSPSACVSCGSRAFKPFGAGTQRVQDELAADIEGLRLMRFDRDTTRGRDGHRQLLSAFAAGAADVLVGTQMLAKGMDLPSVTLAAVLAADGLLHRPDLRSSEECLQLLLQLAGRAGRGEKPGEVLVQTYSPGHPVLRHFVHGAYEPFLLEELAHRKAAGLVPFSRACILRLHGTGAATTATAATALAEHLAPQLQRLGWQAIGPAPAPVARVAGRSRWQLLLHGPESDSLPLPEERVMREIIGPATGLTINPDPLHL